MALKLVDDKNLESIFVPRLEMWEMGWDSGKSWSKYGLFCLGDECGWTVNGGTAVAILRDAF